MSHLTLSQRAAEDVRTMHRQLNDAQYVLNRALGLVPQVVVGEGVRVTSQARQSLALPDVLFTITEIVGAGPDAMTTLKGPDGARIKWFRATELLRPAGRREAVQGDADAQLLSLAHRIVSRSHGTVTLGDAVKQASAQRLDLSEQYREQFGTSAERAKGEQTPISLRQMAPEPFTELVERTVREQGVDYRRAVQLASRARPDLAAAHVRG